MNEIKELFDIDWLKEWKKMMCRRAFINDYDICIRDVNDFPCSDCQYYVKDEKMNKEILCKVCGQKLFEFESTSFIIYEEKVVCYACYASGRGRG